MANSQNCTKSYGARWSVLMWGWSCRCSMSLHKFRKSPCGYWRNFSWLWKLASSFRMYTYLRTKQIVNSCARLWIIWINRFTYRHQSLVCNCPKFGVVLVLSRHGLAVAFAVYLMSVIMLLQTSLVVKSPVTAFFAAVELKLSTWNFKVIQIKELYCIW